MTARKTTKYGTANTQREQSGVTLEQYERLLAAQGGHCAICPNTPKTRRLHVDHEHRGGPVRGLLCYRCNRFLHGWMTWQWLRRASCYVDPLFAKSSAARAVLDEINGIGKDETL